MTILLCTKETLLQTTLSFRFRKVGWTLKAVSDEAAAKKALNHSYPDLAIVDLHMPDYAGLDIIQMLRREAGAEFPIIAGSQLDEVALIREALRLGASDFIGKPYRPDELIIRIQKLTKSITAPVLE
jgi:DNA-binding response OmpR family regulator